MAPLSAPRVSLSCVPVSTTAQLVSKHENCVPALIGTNSRHMQRLVGVLVHSYGWILGQDGNLYAPDSSLAWGERVG